MLRLKIAKRKHRENNTYYLEESVCDIPWQDAQDHDFVSDDRIQKLFGLNEIKKDEPFSSAFRCRIIQF